MSTINTNIPSLVAARILGKNNQALGTAMERLSTGLRINAGKDALEAALIDAGVTHQMNVYPDVQHAFHNDTGGRYVEEQATQAWQDTLAWFKTHV